MNNRRRPKFPGVNCINSILSLLTRATSTTLSHPDLPRSHRASANMQPTRILQALRYRRLRLTTKDVNKGFYKGTRSGAMGRHTKHGGYIIEWNKVRTYVCPSLEGFKVRQNQSNRRLRSRIRRGGG